MCPVSLSGNTQQIYFLRSDHCLPLKFFSIIQGIGQNNSFFYILLTDPFQVHDDQELRHKRITQLQKKQEECWTWVCTVVSV